MAKLTANDRDALRRCVDAMRTESPDDFEALLAREGIEAIALAACVHVQSRALRLKPWQTPPADIWGYDQHDGIALRNQLKRAKISIYEPDPKAALDAANNKRATR